MDILPQTPQDSSPQFSGMPAVVIPRPFIMADPANKAGFEKIRSEIVDKCPVLKAGESIQKDEDNEALLGVGSFAEYSQVHRFEKTLRSMQKNFNNCSPNLANHNEHYILKCMGVNSVNKINKVILREREGIWKGYILIPSDTSDAFAKLLSAYEDKKRKFQKDLENNKGDEERFKRLLDMAVNTITEFKVTYENKNMIPVYINSKYKLDMQSIKELRNIILMLLDPDTDVFKEYKDKVKEFIHDKPKRGNKRVKGDCGEFSGEA